MTSDTPERRFPSTHRALAEDGGSARLWLMVFGDEHFASHPLPLRGEISLGREDSCDIPIDEASISRRHALLRIGDTLTIEDLGSANGTRIRGQAIKPLQPEAIRLGEVVELGATSILLQRRAAPLHPRRIWPNSYFEARVGDECARAAEGGEPFAVAVISTDDTIDFELLQEVLAQTLHRLDVAGRHSATETSLLLLRAQKPEAETRISAIIEALSDRKIAARSGIACFSIDGREADELIGNAASRARPTAPPPEVRGGPVIIRDSEMAQLYRVIDQVAAGTLSVLLLGETGVGKEVIAESVHRRSPRADRPFLRLNCAALAENLLESELFGHEKGAFTGASQTKPGLLETAEGGTVFLDEVGELRLSTQVKLLRVLEERRVMRVGGLETFPIDVRFIAATNRDLEAEIAARTFREDLYYRLAGITLMIPPLRDRISEIAPLARTFAAAASDGRTSLAAAAISRLERHVWPGNIRELRNVIERAVLMCPGDVIGVEHLPRLEGRLETRPPEAKPAASVDDLRSLYPGEAERERIIAALAECGGNQTKAAKMLGISRRTLISRIERYGLPRPRKKKG